MSVEMATCRTCGLKINRASDFVHFMHEDDCIKMDVDLCACDRTFCADCCPLCSEAEEDTPDLRVVPEP